MDNILLQWIFGIIGNFVSVLVFLSPIKTFCSVVKKKSTQNYKVDPYITTLLSTSLWTFYGILTPDGMLVLTVNGAGAFLQSIYVSLFLFFAPKPKKIRTAILVGLLNIGFVGLVIAVTLLATHGREVRRTFIGILCAALTIGMYAAPLSAMRLVIKTKSVEYMPFLLSFFLFLNGGVWGTYAWLLKDFYIGVPNSIGFLLGFAQLILYAIYKRKSSSSTESSNIHGGKMEEEMRSNNEKTENGLEDKEAAIGVKNKNLIQIKSLPLASVERQSSLNNLLRTLSASACDLQSANWFNPLNENHSGKL